MAPASFQPPMLAQLVKPSEHVREAGWVPGRAATEGVPGRAATDWVYERKLDGLRCVAVRHGSQVELWSRNRLSFNSRFPGVVAAIAALGIDDVTLDGELVAYAGAQTSFAQLQRPDPDTRPVLAVFDVLHLLGHDVTHLPLADRKRLLAQALEAAPPELQLVEPLEGDALTLLHRACDAGWEGLVAKRLSSPYRAGRSSAWQKLKCTASREVVVGGWTDPTGARMGLGALVVGYYDDHGALCYAGKVGTGFSDRVLRSLHGTLAALASETSPFAEPVPLKHVHWVRPELVAEVSFSEWTRDGRLRHPAFLGLRDRPASEVRRNGTETP